MICMNARGQTPWLHKPFTQPTHVVIVDLSKLNSKLWTIFCTGVKTSNHENLIKFSTHFTLKMEAARSFETLVSYHITTRRHNPQDNDFKPQISYHLAFSFCLLFHGLPSPLSVSCFKSLKRTVGNWKGNQELHSLWSLFYGCPPSLMPYVQPIIS